MPTLITNLQEADKDDSIKINFDAFSCTQNASDDQVACSFANKVNKSDELLVSDLKAILENEKKHHQETATKLHDLNLKWMREKKSWKELETDFAKEKTALEDQLKKVTWELNSYKDQCRKYEEQTLTLSNDLKTKAENIDDLKRQLNELKNSFEAERTRERSDFKKKELESEKYCKAVVKERIEAQLKCEEYLKNMKRVNETLENEKIKSKNFTEALDKAKEESISLRETVKNLEGTIERIKRELEIEKENINQLTDANNNLKAELEAAGRSEVELKERVSSQYQPPENQTGFYSLFYQLIENFTLLDLREFDIIYVSRLYRWLKNSTSTLIKCPTIINSRNVEYLWSVNLANMIVPNALRSQII